MREHGPVLFWLMIATTAWEQPLFIAGGVGGWRGFGGVGGTHGFKEGMAGESVITTE